MSRVIALIIYFHEIMKNIHVILAFAFYFYLFFADLMVARKSVSICSRKPIYTCISILNDGPATAQCLEIGVRAHIQCMMMICKVGLRK